ncbi:hypothetical protein VPH35_068495 [Triticum aestivum]|nr:uncharacterized protein LOC123082753 isoform X2 [Triticum aestivum]
MQPIGTSTRLEEVRESLVPANGAMVAEQHRPVDSGEAHIFAAKEASADRRESSPPTSELSTGKMNPQAPGWNKRLGAAATSKTPCPNQISEFEKDVRCFAENPAENLIKPVLATTFDSLGEAYDFYNLYSREEPAYCQEDEMHAGNSVWVLG